MFDNLKKYKILLASKSPRRRELLQQLRLPFKTISIGGIEEKYPPSLPVDHIPEYLSNLKADAYNKNLRDDEMVITADTLVILGNEVLGKPDGHDDAVKMLKKLSGRTHKVITGVTVSTSDKRTSFSTTTEVKFADLSDGDIEYYVDNYLPFDKAGAYGIQEWIGCVAVEAIDGSFYNVMGLPVHRLFKELKDF